MKLAALFVLASLTTVVACEDKKPDTTSTTSAAMGDKGAGDNTKRNEVDKGNTVTPIDQGNGQADLDTTASIRKALMSEDSLSTNAKNAKVITNNGVITLRGAVNTQAEKTTLVARAKENAGSNKVVDELTIAAP
jgi:osmotically-inducible protein OsmY